MNPVRKPPEKIKFLKFLKNAMRYRFESFWPLNVVIFKTKKWIATVSTTLRYHSNDMLLNNMFRHFDAKALQNSAFLAVSMKGVLNIICCGGLGFVFRYIMVSWLQFLFHTIFRASLTLVCRQCSRHRFTSVGIICSMAMKLATIFLH